MDSIRSYFRFYRSGQFYLLTGGITDQHVTTLFDAVSDEQNQRIPSTGAAGTALGPHSCTGNVERREVRRAIAQSNIDGHSIDIKCSLLVRSFPHSPTFAPRSGLIEHSYSYLLLVEMTIRLGADQSQYLFVQRDGTADPMKHGFHALTQQIDFAAFLHQFITTQPGTAMPTRIEKMAMRMMASSEGEIRRKTIDSYDVAASTSSLGLHRTIAGSMSVTRHGGASTEQIDLSPQRHRVRKGASRISYDALVRWVAECAVGFFSSRNISIVASSFLAQMAQPLLDLIGKDPCSLFIERGRFNSAIQRFTDATGKAWEAHPTKTPSGWNLDYMIALLSEPMQLSVRPRDRAGNVISLNPMPSEVFYFLENPLPRLAGNDLLKVRVTSKTCKVILPKGAGHFVLANGIGYPTPLDEILNEVCAFRIVFENGSALFCSEGAFRSSNIQLATDQLCRIFRPVSALANVIREKGHVTRGATSFEATSSFYAIENDNNLSAASSVLICDDATNEWCDYLELNQGEHRARWMHAKVQPVETSTSKTARAQQKSAGQQQSVAVFGPVSLAQSLSASDLHDVVGQATKNLAKLRISSNDAEFASRCDRWLNGHCTLPRASSIARLRRGGPIDLAGLQALVHTIASDPISTYEVAIVVPNYSARYLTAELSCIQAGTASLSTVQVFWLLSGFMHACLEVGAKPLVFMQP